MIDASLISKVKTLSVADRLELIEAVWETLPAQSVPTTDAEKALIDARLADLDAHPDDQSPWAETRARLRGSLP